jgi:enoyl-CoA hydratase/carnithine racemase
VPQSDAGRWAEKQLRDIGWLQAAINAVEESRPPVIAAVQGGCIGAGVDLISACDVRVAAADAYFRIAEVDVGITADLGTLQRLPHLIPGGVVREMALTGRRMDAAEALRWGLVTQVAADREAAIAAAMALARTIAAKSPMAVAGTKARAHYARGAASRRLRDVAQWNAATLMNADLGAAMIAARGGDAGVWRFGGVAGHVECWSAWRWAMLALIHAVPTLAAFRPALISRQ